jgi:hypothetical protein
MPPSHLVSYSIIIFLHLVFCIISLFDVLLEIKKLSLSLFSKERRLKTRIQERTSTVCGAGSESQADAFE